MINSPPPLKKETQAGAIFPYFIFGNKNLKYMSVIDMLTWFVK